MPQEEKICVGKYTINYIKVGHGSHCVLCLPGALGSVWTDFKAQIEGFDRDKFTLVVWDAPGYGKSRPPEREFRSDYYEQDVDISLQFMKALNITKFSVLGWCYGGVSGIFLAAKYPETVHKLLVWGARAYIQWNEIEQYKKLFDINLWSKTMLKPKMELYGDEGLLRLWAQVIDAMETLYHTNNGITIPSEVMKKVNCPTLLFHGEKDPLIDIASVYPLHENIRGSRMHIYREGKHNIQSHFAEDFNRRVQEFLLED